MKKALLIVVIIVVVILALPVINLIRWTFQTKKPMEILLVDKTVPDLERIEHRSFDWVLTNERFVKKENKRSYSYKKDYFGFVPIKLTRTNHGIKRSTVLLILVQCLIKQMRFILLIPTEYIQMTGTGVVEVIQRPEDQGKCMAPLIILITSLLRR